MNILIRVISIVLILAGAHLISSFFLDTAEPDENSVVIVTLGILLSCILQAGLFLSTTNIGSQHRIKTAIAMLPGTYLYFGAAYESVSRFITGKSYAMPASAVFVIAVVAYVIAYRNLFKRSVATSTENSG